MRSPGWLWTPVLVVAVLLSARLAEAQTTTWTGGGTTTFWSDAANWSTPPLSSGTYTISFSGTTKTSSFNNSVTAVKSNIIGNSAGIQFTNDGTAGKNGQFVLSGSAITLYGDIRLTNPAASNAISMTDEIKNDLRLTSAASTLAYTASYGSLSHNLILSGAISEASSGLVFRKSGSGGTLFLSGENTFTGMMQIYYGPVSVDRFENIGAPSPLGAGNLPIQVGNGNLSASIIYTGSGETTNRYITVGAGPANTAIGGATITNNGSGPLIFDAANRSAAGANPYDNGRFNTNYQGDNTAPSRTLTLSGTNVTDSEIRSVIADQTYASVTTSIPLTKTGSGKWILSGANTYSGTTAISGGTLQVGNSGTTGNLGAGPVVNNATLVFKRSDDIAYDLDITGTGTLVKAGAGVLTFGTAQSYTGATSIEAGTLSLGEAGSIAASSRITIGAGASFSVADVLMGAYAVPATQTLGGDGTVVGGITLSGGATLAPGAGPGTLSVTDAVTWNSGGNYNWQMLSATGTAGSTGSWDLLSAGGSLTIASTSADPFKVNLWTLSGVVPEVSGSAANFNPAQNYTWKIASAGGGISGFAANKFLISTSATNGTGGFANSLGGGTFSISQSGNNLNLVFTAMAPSVITINVASGTQTQAQAGYPTLSGTVPVVKTGSGTLVVNAANTLTGSTTVQGGRLQLANPSALGASKVVPLTGGTVSLAPYLQTTVGGLAPNAGGLVDLGNGLVTVASGLTPTELVTAILAGRGDGSWTGTTGITSSVAASDLASGIPRAVGWLDNGDGSVTAAFAAPGDTNLDWVVDVLDAGNFLTFGKYDTGLPATWLEGDFNYDGVVDVLDASEFFGTGLYDTGNYNTPAGIAGAVAAVPEPSTWLMTLVSLGTVGWLASARRRFPRG